MLKDQYLHRIIWNLGIAISPENNSEIIIKNDIFYDKKNKNYILNDEFNIFYQDYGTIICDFQNTDFSNKQEFLNFYNKYSLLGIDNKKYSSLFIDKKCSAMKYDLFVDKTLKKYQKLLIGYQKDINYIIDYCLFKPTKKTANLSPFERLCLLEYLPNTPSLLQENMMQLIQLNTLSDINEDIVSTEDDLIYNVNNNKTYAYTNNLYIPLSISSLLHFELSEIMKNKVILKICNYCNKFFISSNNRIAYCLNIAPGYTNKTCRQVARYKKHIENQNKDEALSLFTKVYNNKAYKSARYKDIKDYYIDYKHFQEVGRKKVQAYKNNRLSKEDFIEWINRNKK